MSFEPGNGDLAEKHVASSSPGPESKGDGKFTHDDPEHLGVVTTENTLRQDLQGRHMQMIAMQVQHSGGPSSIY